MSNNQYSSINILFTSAGRRVQLLKAFCKAYDTLGIRGSVIATDIDPLAPALQIANKTFIVPRLDVPTYIPKITDLCQREHIDFIFPLIDPDIPKLAQHRTQIEATGARLMVILESSMEKTNDKWRTYEFFNSIEGVLTPRSWLPEQLDFTDLPGYPLFIKPRGGSASKHTYKVSNRRELEFFCEYIPSPIIQEYMPGPEITNDVICDVDREILAVVSRQRIQVRGGEVAKGKTIYDERIIEGCIKIAKALPAIGPITVQCMMKDGVPYFTEINARLGGGAPLAIAAGVNFAEWLLARAANISIDIPPIGTYQQDLFLTRFDDAYYLTQEDYEHFKSLYI